MTRHDWLNRFKSHGTPRSGRKRKHIPGSFTPAEVLPERLLLSAINQIPADAPSVQVDYQRLLAGEKFGSGDVTVDMTTQGERIPRINLSSTALNRNPDGRSVVVYGLPSTKIKVRFDDLPHGSFNTRWEISDDGEIYKEKKNTGEKIPDVTVTLREDVSKANARIWNTAGGQRRDMVDVYIATDNSAPTGSLEIDNDSIDTPTGAPVTFTLEVSDDSMIDDRTISDARFRVTGPKPTVFSSVDIIARDGSDITIGGNIYDPSGSWDITDNGTYTLEYIGGIKDMAGKELPAGLRATFTVEIVDEDPPRVASSVTTLPEIRNPHDAREITVNYTDNVGINTSTIGGDDLEVYSPNGDELDANVSVVRINGSGSRVDVTYRISPPDEGYSKFDNSPFSYSIVAAEDGIEDLEGNGNLQATVGRVKINVPDPVPVIVDESRFELSLHEYSVEIDVEEILTNVEDPDDDLIIFEGIASQPSFGSVTETGGILTYSPREAFAGGEDSFAVYVSDGSSTGRIRVPVYIDVELDESAPEMDVEFLFDEIVDWKSTGPHEFLVTFTDDRSIRDDSIGDDNFVAVAPGDDLPDLEIREVNRDQTSLGTIEVLYEIVAPDGGWLEIHNGTWTIELGAGAVEDAAGREVRLGEFGGETFDVNVVGPAPSVSIVSLPEISDDKLKTSVTVEYFDAGGLSSDGFDDGDLALVRQSDGQEFEVLLDTDSIVTVEEDHHYRVTYTIAEPDDDFGWSYRVNGTWDINTTDQVTDLVGTPVDAGTLESVAFHLTNETPAAYNDRAQFREEEGPFLSDFSLLDNDTDRDDLTEDLTVTVVPHADGHRLEIDRDGSFEFIPADSNFVGEVTFEYEVSDGNSSDTGLLVVDLLAVRPRVSPDAYTMSAVDPELFVSQADGLLANDTDPNGLPLTIFGLGTSADAIEAGATALKLEYGTVEVEAGGGFVYRLTDPSVSGPESFFYTAGSDEAESDPVEVRISVAAAPDVRVTSFDITNDRVGPDDIAHVRMAVVNSGGGPAENFEITIIHSDDDIIGNGDDLTVKTIPVDRLEAGERREIEFDVQLDRATLFSRSLREDRPEPGLADVKQSSMRELLAAVVDSDVRPTMPESAESSTAEYNGHTLRMNSDDFTVLHMDVNGDGIVTPRDSAAVINSIGDSDSEHDLNGDGLVTPRDAVFVLNRIGYAVNESVIDDISSTEPVAVDDSSAGRDRDDRTGGILSPAPAVVTVITEDLAGRTGVDVASISVVNIQERKFANGCLGPICPAVYLGFDVDGHELTLSASGELYAYNTAEGDFAYQRKLDSGPADKVIVTTVEPDETSVALSLPDSTPENAPEADPTGQLSDDFVEIIRDDLAHRMKTGTSRVTFVSAEATAWDGSSLGTEGLTGELDSTSEAVQGYRVTFSIVGQIEHFVYHTAGQDRYEYAGRTPAALTKPQLTLTNVEADPETVRQNAEIDSLFVQGLADELLMPAL